MASLQTLNSLRIFAAAARRLNFSYAAEVLNVALSAVSYQIKELKNTSVWRCFTDCIAGLCRHRLMRRCCRGGASRIDILFP